MRYRIRARRGKAARHVLSIEMLNHSMFTGGWTQAEYFALRDDYLATYGPGEPYWEHEPGLPAVLRQPLPDPGDTRYLVPGPGYNPAQFTADQAAHDAVVAAREAWLADHPLEERAA